MSHIIFALLLLISISAQSRSIPSNLDPAKILFVVYNGSNTSLVKDYIRLLNRQNLNNPRPTRLVIFHSKDSLDALNELIDSNSKSYITAVQKNGDELSETGGFEDWLQDAGEFFINKNGLPQFLHHTEYRDNVLLNYIQDQLKITTTSISDKNNNGLYSVEGGNIEATPGGSVYLSSNLSPSYISTIEKIVGKDKVIKISTEKTNVGHVDESYQFIPAKNSCGYALAYSDHLDALRLMLAFNLLNGEEELSQGKNRSVGAKEYLESLSYFTNTDSKNIKFELTSFQDLALKFNYGKLPRPANSFLGSRKEDVYIYKAFEAHSEVIRGLRQLKDRAAKEGCANLQLIPLPALWTYGFNDQLEPGLSSKELLQYKVSNLTAFTNLVSLNGALVIPDTEAPSQLLHFLSKEEFAKIGSKLKEVVISRLTKIGYKNEDIIFTDVSGAILGDGAAHCKTNVLRELKK